MDNLIKILGVLDKPYHYLLVGLFLIVWKYFFTSELDLYLWGGIFIVIAVASIIEKIVNFIKTKITIYKVEKQEKENKEKLKKYYINEYNNMNSIEKKILDYCIKNNTLTYTSSIYATKEDISHIYSLVGKGFGKNITYGGDFMLKQSCYDILSRYINPKENTEN